MINDMLRNKGQIVEAFPLYSGQVNIAAAGGAKLVLVFCCAIDGNFTVTFNDGVQATIAMVAGEVFSIPSGGTVLATGAATFHYIN